FCLTAPSVNHLCKSIVLENTRCSHTSYDNPLDSRYYCVVIQYVASIDVSKLVRYIRQALGCGTSKKQYNFRLVSAEQSHQLTGFANNGVCPIGLATPIPVFIDHAICQLQPPVLYLGAGHPDWKLALPVKTFCQIAQCHAIDLAQ
ncbi:hypothetical protein H4R34_004803, partial [Dimargaris verticillata]